MVLGNGAVAAGEDGTETLTGKMDWSSVGSDSSDKRDAGELSGQNPQGTHREPTGNPSGNPKRTLREPVTNQEPH